MVIIFETHWIVVSETHNVQTHHERASRRPARQNGQHAGPYRCVAVAAAAGRKGRHGENHHRTQQGERFVFQRDGRAARHPVSEDDTAVAGCLRAVSQPADADELESSLAKPKTVSE